MQTNVGRRLLPGAFYSLGLLCSVGCHRKGGFTDSKGVRTKSRLTLTTMLLLAESTLTFQSPFARTIVCLTMTLCGGRLPTTLRRCRAEALRKPNSLAESRLMGGDAVGDTVGDTILPDH